MPLVLTDPDISARRHPLAAVWLVLLLVIGVAGVLHWLIPYGATVAAINGAASLLSALAVLAAWRLRRGLYQARGWLLVGLAGLSSFVGHVIWYTADLGGAGAEPRVPYLFYLLTYGLLIAGLWLFGRQVETREGALIDALMLVVAAAVLFWAVMIEPHLGAPGGDALGLVIASAYPVADLLLLMFALKLFFLAAERSTALLMLMAAVGTLLAADLVHAYGVTSGWYARGGLTDVLWYGVYALMAAAAWHPSATQPLTYRPTGEHRFLHLPVIGLLAISVPATILFTAHANHDLLRVGALAAVALFALMLIRMTLLLRRNQQQADALRHLIRTDPLTGAVNRRGLAERLELEIARARRTGSPLAVAYIDLDNFKQYNDRHGHAAGDELLRATVARWQQEIRDTDLLARAGGEEFVLVCPDSNLAACVNAVERMRSVMPEHETCSAGVTDCRDHDSADTLLGRADEGLYQAKRQGRDRIVVRG